MQMQKDRQRGPFCLPRISPITNLGRESPRGNPSEEGFPLGFFRYSPNSCAGRVVSPVALGKSG